MAIEININELIAQIKNAASNVINQDITIVSGFSERQVKALALQAELIAKGVANGQIDNDLRDFFLDSLKTLARNFVEALHGLLVITIEKIWNAIVNVLWGAVETATGFVLPAPTAKPK